MSNRQRRRNMRTGRRVRGLAEPPGWLTEAVRAAPPDAQRAAAKHRQERYLQALIRRLSEGQP